MKKVSGVVRMGRLVLFSVLLLSSPVLAAWGSKEMETERIAVTLVREVERGGYKIVTTIFIFCVMRAQTCSNRPTADCAIV
jgi:hypothetical protein